MKSVLALLLLSLSSLSHAHLTVYTGTFAPEVAGATGSGSLYMEYDDDGHTLFIQADFTGLSGLTNNAHIHCCTAAPNTGTAGVALAQGGLLPGFPLGISGGSYTRLIDLTQANQYSAAFVTASGGTASGAEQRLIANLTSGNAYFNIHSTTFGGGEIRAFVTAVPEPASQALMGAGVAVVALLARRRRRT
ncbi:MAG: CHRD domain-containing protein [Rubrivivax sp.]|nr:CHRD domain-containing protein [Rubrivivax sp.]